MIPAVALLLHAPIHGLAQPPSPAVRDAALIREPAIAPRQPAIIWRVDGGSLEGRAPLYHAFSPDGGTIGIVYPSRAIRLLDAADGSLVEELPPQSAARLTYSMAIASTGRVAVGRPGSMEVFEVSAGGPIAILPCAQSSCVPTSLAFSPDGSLLALHEVTPRWQERQTPGAVRVVDLELGGPTRMQASTGLAELAFSSEALPPGAGTARNGFRIWHTSDWRLPQSLLGGGWTVGSVPADSAEAPVTLVAVFRSGSNLVMRDFANDRLLWAAPLIAPQLASARSAAARSELERVELAPNGRFLIGYESPRAGGSAADGAGAIVVRRTLDGALVAVYEVPDVADLAIAPDSETFVYSTGAARTRTALARVPDL